MDAARRAALTRAYAGARYRLALPDGERERRIGVADAAADAALRAAGCRSHWHFLTPCNAHSRPADGRENAARLLDCESRLRNAGWRCCRALAHAPDGTWPEEGFCVFDAPDTAVRALARDFGQNAIVRGALDAPPELLWLNTE